MHTYAPVMQRCCSHCVQIQTDVLLPNPIRRMFKRQSHKVYYGNRKNGTEKQIFKPQYWLRFLWEKISKETYEWGAENWNSVEFTKGGKGSTEQLEMVSL